MPLAHLPEGTLSAPYNFAEALFSISLGIDDCNTQEKWKTMVNMQNVGGGGANKVHYGRCASSGNVTGQIIILIQGKIF